MATVVELRPRAKDDFTASLGMVVFLAAWAMMFATLFFAYLFVRASAPAWPVAGVPRLPVALPAFNTVVMAASSLAFMRGLEGLRRGRRSELTRWVGVTLGLGVLFLALQGVVWQSLSSAGLHFAGDIYGGVFYALTSFHAIHVAVGVGVLGVVLYRSARGRYTEHNFVNVRLCAMFWHFVDVVWFLMFVSLYLF